MALKRIPRPIIDEAFEEIDENEYRDVLAALIASRAHNMGDEARTYEGRTRLFRAAAARGFETELIAAELKKFL